ncbi:hypothetical protein Q9R32_01840 [Actinotalea sp. AC32]|nr:hypothetical protein [Actinotalea sp. AC32]
MHMPRGLLPALSEHGLGDPRPMGAGPEGDRWVCLDGHGTRWVVSVVRVRSAVQRDRLVDRARRLVSVSVVARSLPTVLGLLELPDGLVALVRHEVPGTDLLTVGEGRGRWRAAEVVGVVAAVAEALDALHAVGLVHGDVSAGNVVVTPDGGAVLVDLGWGDDAHELGTPAAAAPERVRGATRATDVHALASVGIDLLRQGPGLPGPSGDVGDGSDDVDAWRVREVLREAAAPDPERRPSARALAAALVTACPPEPVRLPESAVLARAALLRRAADDDQRTRRRPPSATRGRHRRPRPVRHVVALGVGTVVVVAAGAAAVLGQHGAAVGDGLASEAAARATGPAPLLPGADDAVVAAVTATHVRARALADGDLLRLSALTVPGSPAAAADRAAWSALDGRRGRAVVLVSDVRGGAVGGGRAEVEVLSAAALAGDDARPGPAPEPRWAGLELVRGGTGWLVRGVRPVDAPG